MSTEPSWSSRYGWCQDCGDLPREINREGRCSTCGSDTVFVPTLEHFRKLENDVKRLTSENEQLSTTIVELVELARQLSSPTYLKNDLVCIWCGPIPAGHNENCPAERTRRWSQS